jgi:cyanophycinase-like exopeptidase
MLSATCAPIPLPAAQSRLQVRFTHLGRIVALFLAVLLTASQARGAEEETDIEEDFYALPNGSTSLVVRAGVLANDTLPFRRVQVRVIHGPRNGNLMRWNEKDGTFVYQADPHWKGTDHFEYEVRYQGRPVGSAIVTIGTRYKGYTYYVDSLSESQSNVPRAKPGFMLVGGMERRQELDDAYTWLIQHANGNAPADGKCSLGGSVLILTVRKAPAELTAAWVRKTAEERKLRLRSVESIVFDSMDVKAAREAALHDARIRHKLSEAGAVFMPGGDQRAYLNLWKGTQVQDILNERMKQGTVVVGGSSAGLHVLAEGCSAPRVRPDRPPNSIAGMVGITNREALSTPDCLTGMLEADFLHAGFLPKHHVITESHFRQRNWFETNPSMRGRMGRLLAFMARMSRDRPEVGPIHGLGIEETTAVLVESDGKSTVVGKGCAFFLTPQSRPHYGKEKEGKVPLSWEKLRVQKVRAGGTFDLDHWEGLTKTEDYTIALRQGTPVNTQDPERDVYNYPRVHE